MKKIIIGCALMMAIAACGDNSAGSGEAHYDTSAKATSGSDNGRDSITAAMARNNAAKDSASGKSTASDRNSVNHGGVPAGTIDSGMTNVGARKSMKHHKK